jgi:hypothetical protein
MGGLGRVLVLRAIGVFPVATIRMRGMGTVRLAQYPRFFKFMTFAGDKGRGRKNQEQVGNFHRAP